MGFWSLLWWFCFTTTLSFMYTVYLLDPRPFDSFDPTVVKLFHPHSIISSNKILCEAEQMRWTWERCKTVRTSPGGGTRQPASCENRSLKTVGRSAFSCILAWIFPILWFCLRFWHNRDPTFKFYKLKLKVNKFDFQNKTCLENDGSYI